MKAPVTYEQLNAAFDFFTEFTGREATRLTELKPAEQNAVIEAAIVWPDFTRDERAWEMARSRVPSGASISEIAKLAQQIKETL